MSDEINNPPHYSQGKIKPIDVIEDWELGSHESNVIKYIARAKHKGNELKDLKKAQWYLNRVIELKSALVVKESIFTYVCACGCGAQYAPGEMFSAHFYDKALKEKLCK